MLQIKGRVSFDQEVSLKSKTKVSRRLPRKKGGFPQMDSLEKGVSLEMVRGVVVFEKGASFK